MSQMRAAVSTRHLDAAHAVALVPFFLDVFFFHRRPKARPSGAGVELGLRIEEVGSAADALIDAGVLGVPVFSGEWRFGAFESADFILFRSEMVVIIFFHRLPVQNDAVVSRRQGSLSKSQQTFVSLYDGKLSFFA